MQTAQRHILTGTHGPGSRPQITVGADEIFRVQTELATGGWLRSPADRWTPDRTSACNPTVVIAVDGALPGDILAVKILSLVPDTVGYTGFTDETNPICRLIKNREWNINTKTVEIRDGFVLWDDKRKLPIKPMIGTLGTAPAEEALSNAKGGPHGGNMDVPEVRAGSTVYLPVYVPGALLHVGDCHALQGDGEINCAGGVECRAEAVLQAEVIRGKRPLSCVRIEDEAYIMTVSCGRSLEESFYDAAAGMLEWMVEYGFTEGDAYLLMGQVLEARATQFVNPTRTYICKMPKEYL